MSQKMSQILLRIAYVCLRLLKRKPAATSEKLARPAGIEPATYGFEVMCPFNHTYPQCLAVGTRWGQK